MTARDRIAWLTFDHIAVIAAIGIAIVSLLPKSNSVGISASDSLDHMAAYCLLTILSQLRRRTRSSVLFMGLAIFAFGAAIELIQPVFGRFAEWSDLAANGAGILIAIALVTTLRQARRLRSR